MKLRKLDITNIASISHASIDFRSAPLADSPIFLICGETGSGKSTILDAICLALYNKTPRLTNGNRTEENTYREGSQNISIVSVGQLLKKGEKDGAVSLLFEGADGSDYLAEWKCRINRNGRLEDETWTVTDCKGKTDSSKGRKREERMTDIIGLDYDQFCRTSMLAQGQFTQFLKAETKDKSDILEKITGTEIYAAIGSRIHQKAKDANDAFKAADREVNSVILLPDEERNSYIRELEEIDAVIMKNTSAGEFLDTLLKAFEAIETSEEAIRKSEETLDGARATFALLSADMAYRKAVIAKMQEQAEGLTVKVEGQKGCAGMYSNVQAIESLLGNVIRQKGIQDTQKGILEKEKMAFGTASETLAALKERRSQAEGILGQRSQAVSRAQEARMALDPEGVEKERKAISDGLDLAGKAGTDFATIQYKEEGLAVARADFASVETLLRTERESIKALEENAASADSAFKEIKTTYDIQAQVLDKAAVRVREWLRETGAGECPVCHARITSLLTTEQEEDNLRPLRNLVDRKKAEKDAADHSLTQARIALATRESEHGKAKDRVRLAEVEIEALKADFSRKYSPLGITGKEGDLKGVLGTIAESFGRRKKTNEAAIAAVAEKQNALDAATKERDSYKKDVFEPLDRECMEAEKAITAIKGRMDACCRMKEAAETAEKESMAKAAQLITMPGWEIAWDKDADGFIAGVKDAAKAYGEAVRALDDTAKAIESQDKAIKDAADVHDRILAADCSLQPESISPAAFAGNAIIAWGALENTVITARESISASRKIIMNSRETLDSAFGKNPDLPGTKDGLQSMKALLSSEVIEKSTRSGVLRQIIDDDDSRSEALRDKRARRDEASRLNAQWKTLDDLFGGKDGFTFKKIAQSYIMQDILNHANAYLRKIAPRYELTAQPGSLVILVKDNDEGGVRSGNTLSGGEGFVISLSLALGLSSLAENSISVDTIFIDEGFGTLSQEWLNSVMAALEKLNATSGRHVGIISHIEDLQKRIPTVIEVRKKNATTSEITVRG